MTDAQVAADEARTAKIKLHAAALIKRAKVVNQRNAHAAALRDMKKEALAAARRKKQRA